MHYTDTTPDFDDEKVTDRNCSNPSAHSRFRSACAHLAEQASWANPIKYGLQQQGEGCDWSVVQVSKVTRASWKAFFQVLLSFLQCVSSWSVEEEACLPKHLRSRRCIRKDGSVLVWFAPTPDLVSCGVSVHARFCSQPFGRAPGVLLRPCLALTSFPGVTCGHVRPQRPLSAFFAPRASRCRTTCSLPRSRSRSRSPVPKCAPHRRVDFAQRGRLSHRLGSHLFQLAGPCSRALGVCGFRQQRPLLLTSLPTPRAPTAQPARRNSSTPCCCCAPTPSSRLRCYLGHRTLLPLIRSLARAVAHRT